jgi:drug/metabolite transporter (DMT)-like permease
MGDAIFAGGAGGGGS